MARVYGDSVSDFWYDFVIKTCVKKCDLIKCDKGLQVFG